MGHSNAMATALMILLIMALILLCSLASRVWGFVADIFGFLIDLSSGLQAALHDCGYAVAKP